MSEWKQKIIENLLSIPKGPELGSLIESISIDYEQTNRDPRGIYVNVVPKIPLTRIEVTLSLDVNSNETDQTEVLDE